MTSSSTIDAQYRNGRISHRRQRGDYYNSRCSRSPSCNTMFRASAILFVSAMLLLLTTQNDNAIIFVTVVQGFSNYNIYFRGSHCHYRSSLWLLKRSQLPVPGFVQNIIFSDANDASKRKCKKIRNMRRYFTTDENGTSADETSSSSKYVSAAEKERRAEIKRRLERKSEVIIGKTSAVPEAKDFELNVKATERALMDNVDTTAQQVRIFSDKGLFSLKCGDLEQAKVYFDKVYELKPNAYLWQAGIVMFYLGDTFKAAECFANNANIYESRFGEPASEERIWRDACELMLRRSIKRKRKSLDESSQLQAEPILTPPILSPEIAPPDNDFPRERRKAVRIARQLFSSAIEGDNTMLILCIAKLRHLTLRRGTDRMRWKLHAWFFLGLYYDSVREISKGKYSMKNALIKSGGSKNTDDILATLPLLHMTHRDWFNDDDVKSIDEEDIDLKGSTNYITAIIKEEAKVLSRKKLQHELKKQGFKCTASNKPELQETFVNLLVSMASTDDDFMI